MLATASVVARDMSARATTSMGNTIATEHSHLIMHVLAQNLLNSVTLHMASTVIYQYTHVHT